MSDCGNVDIPSLSAVVTHLSAELNLKFSFIRSCGSAEYNLPGGDKDNGTFLYSCTNEIF